ncbi:DNA helicase MCM9 [Nematocida sp. LUAm3]|nr:DNA helicase MCM9 [Nematocida sp. LUAm3]
MESSAKIQIDLMKEYDKDPEKALEMLEGISERKLSLLLCGIPSALDLEYFPTSSHYGKIVAIHGTVLKLGVIGFRAEGNKRIDYQEIRMQERRSGYICRTITVQLEGELVDTCHPREILKITGIVRVNWNKLRVGQPIECEYALQALSIISLTKTLSSSEIETKSVSEYALLKEFISMYAPHIQGSLTAKFGLLLCTLGGNNKNEASKEEEDGAPSAERLYREARNKNRASCHMLLVGQSGTGKSDLLSFASSTCSPSVFVTGTGCSSAGLTACALRENNNWMIEPGALPQADGGICCIDEFGSLRKEDKSSILEAMEQQTISVAKAGILMQLDTRCAVLAAIRSGPMNPEYVLSSLKLSPPLISRFDVILLLDGTCASDVQVASSMIDRESDKKELAYIKHLCQSRRNIQVSLSDEAKKVIGSFYQKQRESPSVTVRVLESHIRLTEAYAKLMGRTVAEEKDALITSLLLNSSLSLISLFPYISLEHALGSEEILHSALLTIKTELTQE